VSLRIGIRQANGRFRHLTTALLARQAGGVQIDASGAIAYIWN